MYKHKVNHINHVTSKGWSDWLTPTPSVRYNNGYEKFANFYADFRKYENMQMVLLFD
jgi:hypothetical protein